MRCSNCGEEINNGAAFCTNCGVAVNTEKPETSTPVASQATTASAAAPNPIPRNATVNNAELYSANYKPISMWGYFGYEILFSIPLVGLIVLLVFSFGATSNVNLKNFARSYFCYFIVLAIVIAIFMAMGASMLAFGPSYY